MTRRSADARRSRLNQVGGEGDDDGNKFSFLYCQIMKEATVTRLSRHFFFKFCLDKFCLHTVTL